MRERDSGVQSTGGRGCRSKQHMDLKAAVGFKSLSRDLRNSEVKQKR